MPTWETHTLAKREQGDSSMAEIDWLLEARTACQRSIGIPG
jgi:hypothetical protein